MHLEPLAVGVDEAYEGDRGAADLCGEPGKIIKVGLGGAVQDGVVLEGGEALRLVGGDGWQRRHKRCLGRELRTRYTEYTQRPLR